MKLTITVELDKDSTQQIQTSFSNLTKQLHHLIEIFGNADFCVEEIPVPDPSPVPDPKAATKKKKPKTKGSNPEITLNAIKNHKDGIDFKGLKQETGFTSKQLSNAVFHLKNKNKIEKTEAGLFVVLRITPETPS